MQIKRYQQHKDNESAYNHIITYRHFKEASISKMAKDTNTNVVSGAILTTSKIELQNILNAGLQTKPNEIALFTSDEQQSWTFKKLNEVSDNVAHSYIKLGAKAGDRIASLLPNCVELFVHYVACFKVGLVLVPMNFRKVRVSIALLCDFMCSI